MIEIKKVTEKEKKKVDIFNLKEWKKHDAEKRYISEQKKFQFAAYEEKNIVGSMQGNTNGGIAYLKDIIVSKNSRNKGLGKMLLKKFEEVAKNNKCHACFLRTTDNHPGAILFYQKNGYHAESNIRNMRWHADEYYMLKRLAV